MRTVMWSPGRPRGTRGAVLIWVALMGLVLIGLVGLALDTAHVYYAAQELQAAADASALAGARLVKDDDPATDFEATRAAALEVALANTAVGDAVAVEPNYVNDPDGDVVVGVWDADARTFTPSTVFPDAVRVRARRTASSLGGTVALLFGPIFGVADSEVARTATAHLGAKGPASILVLDPVAQKALELRGNSKMNVLKGEVQVNSSADDALYLNGPPDVPRLTAERIEVVGGTDIPVGSVVPEPITGVEVEPDPFASLPYPDVSGMTDFGSITAADTYFPGYYPGGVDFNSGEAFLNPGVYVFGPPGITLHGSAQIRGFEVMLFIDLDGKFTTSGNSSGLVITPPTSGTYEGISLFQHRDNPNESVIQGGGLFDVGGAMYYKIARLKMEGNVDRQVGSIVVGRLRVRGNAGYTITGEGPPPAGPFYSFLVE